MILVTGTSGFIGKKLHTALVSEYGADHILALSSKPTAESHYLLHNNYTFDNDYISKSGYSAIKTVIHAGAFTPKNAGESNDLFSCASNINSTMKLLQLELPNLKKVIFLSTLDVYGKDNVVSELSPIDPVSLYGDSKLYCEKMIAAWARANDKIFQLFRVGHIYGPGEEAYQKLIPATIKKLLSGQPLQVWGTGNELRSFLFIDDLVSAISKAVKIESGFVTTNLVGGSKIRVRELIDMLIEISNTKPAIDFLPMSGEGRNLIFDNSKMQKELGQMEIPLREGLTAEWEYMARLKW